MLTLVTIVYAYTPPPHWLNWTADWEFWNWFYAGKSAPFWVAERTHIMKYMGMFGQYFPSCRT